MTQEHRFETGRRPRAGGFPLAFIRSRMSGSVPVARVFWKDMIVFGTTINIVAGLLGLLLLAYGAPTALGLSVFFAPLPYNLFLVAAVWKASARLEEPWGSTMRVAGVVWLLVVTII